MTKEEIIIELTKRTCPTYRRQEPLEQTCGGFAKCDCKCLQYNRCEIVYDTCIKNIKEELAEEIFDAIEKIMENNLHEFVCIGDSVEDYYDVDLYDDFWELRRQYVKKKNVYPNEECGSCPVWLNVDEGFGLTREKAIKEHCSKCDLYNEAEKCL